MGKDDNDAPSVVFASGAAFGWFGFEIAFERGVGATVGIGGNGLFGLLSRFGVNGAGLAPTDGTAATPVPDVLDFVAEIGTDGTVGGDGGASGFGFGTDCTADGETVAEGTEALER